MRDPFHSHRLQSQRDPSRTNSVAEGRSLVVVVVEILGAVAVRDCY